MKRDPAKLGREKVSKLLLEFSIPAVIGTMVFASTNIVNTIFIGRGVGSIALTAISLSFPVFSIFMAVGMLVGIGGAALFSIRLGEGKPEEAEKILGNAVFLFIILSLLTSLLGEFFLIPILHGLGASPDSLPYARDYLRIILAGVFFNFIAMGLNNFVRASGHPGIAMMTLVIGAIVNIGLNLLLVIHLHWGVKGAAYATFSSTAFSAGWVIIHFMSGRNGIQLRLKHIGFDSKIMGPALLIGLSPCLMQVAASLIAALCNKSLAHYGGDLAVGSMAVIYSVAMLFIMPIIGINQGAQPVIGFNYGAKAYDRVRAAFRQALIAATVISTIGAALIHLFPHKLVTLFSRGDIALSNVAEPGLRIFLSLVFLVGFQSVAANYFQAIGRPRISILLNLLRQVIIFIPALYILPRFFGLYGVWYSAPLSDFLATAITAVFVIKEYRRLKQATTTTPSFQIR